MSSTLIAAAHEPELETFRQALGASDVAVAAIGVGFWNALSGMELALTKFNPKRCILLGSCGIYPQHAQGVPVGQLVVPQRFALADVAVLTGLAEWVSAPLELHADNQLCATLARGVGANAVGSVLNTLGITTATSTAEALGTTGQLENLEAYAVARACTQRGVPFAACLGVTNIVGPVGRAQWRTNAHEVAGKAGRALASWLEVSR